jgi:hypothetical protein
MNDSFIGLDTGDGKQIYIQKSAVSTLLPKGTLSDMQK